MRLSTTMPMLVVPKLPKARSRGQLADCIKACKAWTGRFMVDAETMSGP